MKLFNIFVKYPLLMSFYLEGLDSELQSLFRIINLQWFQENTYEIKSKNETLERFFNVFS